MNTNAANALLKNLEEPPTRTLFILIVHAPGSLLPTIRSRCQMVRLTPLDADDLMSVLETVEPPPPDDPAARAALAERAGGSARNAILLTQYGGLEIAETLDALVATARIDVAGAYRLAEAVAGRDHAIQFDIFNRRALDLLSDRRQRSSAGRRPCASQNAVGYLARGAERYIRDRHLQSRQETACLDHDRPPEVRDVNSRSATLST